ncbi:hypothetical protein [Archaeoglobus neptunius]|uniref:hypothetical protein n=1 Tax=Archaeoglobus neptunius TaxID=2798580 RepID=UPI0019295EB3|nr:hypothetical protein [Archaeoglobus neptunius]
MKILVFLTFILLIYPVSAICEDEKAEYERAYSNYQANPSIETNNALSSAYKNYVNCISGSTSNSGDTAGSDSSDSSMRGEICKKEEEEYLRAFGEYQSTYDPAEAEKKYVAYQEAYQRYINCISNTQSTTTGSDTVATPSKTASDVNTPQRIRETLRIYDSENLVVISRPTDEIADEKIMEIINELEKQFESYDSEKQNSEEKDDTMDRILVAVDRMIERDRKVRELMQNRDDETRKIVEDVIKNTPEKEKGLVEELMYLALEKGKENAMENTKQYLKNELTKRGYGNLVSKIEKFESLNSKANDYLSKAVELKEIKDEIDGTSKLHKDGKITEDDSRILKAAVGLKKAVSWITSKIPILGGTMSDIYAKSLDAGIKTGVMLGEHKKDVNDLINCLETNTC